VPGGRSTGCAAWDRQLREERLLNEQVASARRLADMWRSESPARRGAPPGQAGQRTSSVRWRQPFAGGPAKHQHPRILPAGRHLICDAAGGAAPDLRCCRRLPTARRRRSQPARRWAGRQPPWPARRRAGPQPPTAPPRQRHRPPASRARAWSGQAQVRSTEIPLHVADGAPPPLARHVYTRRMAQAPAPHAACPRPAELGCAARHPHHLYAGQAASG
jgi:hypothetical protein